VDDLSKTRMRALIEELREDNERKDRTISELREHASRDALTGLLRRWRGVEELTQQFQLAHRRRGQPYAMLFLDIDCFGSFNNDFGHDVGDRVLRAVAQVLREEARASDFAVRWGGEEMVIVCPHTTRLEVFQLARRVRERIEEIETGVRSVTASIGVSDGSEDDEDAFAIVRRADQAMYAAKREGRNRVAQIFAEAG
jgi:diguanylate cyclase (GGDEF)-like protein